MPVTISLICGYYIIISAYSSHSRDPSTANARQRGEGIFDALAVLLTFIFFSFRLLVVKL